MDVARGEMVEKELDAMIERRSRKRGPDEESELWWASVERFDARRREANRQAWTSFHEEQAERHRRTLEDLIRHHETQAERLCEEGNAA